MRLKYKSLEELERSIKVDEDMCRYKTKMIVSAMSGLAEKGKKLFRKEAKEEAYSHFYRYMTLLSMVHTSSDFIKNKSQFKDALKDTEYILTKLEILRVELDAIYKMTAMEKKFEQMDMNKESESQIPESSLLAGDTMDFLKSPAINEVLWISIDRFFDCIKSKLTYIIFDTRSTDEYNASHFYLYEINNVNIPITSLPKGISASMLETVLEGGSQEKWKNRANYDVIILMGYSDHADNISEGVQLLYNIIKKWDPNTHYKHSPLILDFGYQHFSFMYPTYCTAVVKRKLSLNDSDLLDSIIYPDLDTNNDRNNSGAIENQDLDRNSYSLFLPPDFDRSKKPVYIPTNLMKDFQRTSVVRIKKLPDSLFGDNDSVFKTELMEDDSMYNNELIEDVKIESLMDIEPETMQGIKTEPMLDIKTEPQELDDLNIPVFQNQSVKMVDGMKGLETAVKPRSVKKSAPSVDRSKKPEPAAAKHYQLDLFHVIYRAERYDSKKNYAGLTGLQNNSNYCYINSIVQALVHLDDFRDYFLKNQYLKNINRNSKSRGEVTDLLAAMCSFIWSDVFSSISSVRLKQTLGALNKRFAKNTQEDCHEFFMVLIHYLHEELCYSIATPEYASEPEKKFIEYNNNVESVINKFFFGQSETRVLCDNCNFRSSTYTPFGCLTLEIVGTTLTDCLNDFYRKETVDDYRCERCNQKGAVSKETSIFRHPAYLIIHLKRFRGGAGQRDYNKKTDRVDFSTKLKLTASTGISANYKLVSLCTHNGTIDQGHYKAYALHNNEWVLFDDSKVSKIGSNLHNADSNLNRDVYMLFYQNINNH